MKKLVFALLLFVFTSLSHAVLFNDRVRAYLYDNGYTDPLRVTFCQSDGYDFSTIYICGWHYDFPQPTEDQLPDDATTEQILVSYAIAKEAARQEAKPLGQRQYENQFFDLVERLYNVTGVTNEVTPKLGFPEIRELIDTVQASDPMAAVNYSLELLSIDAALKRYSVLWWDDAIQHEIPEE